MRSEDKQDAFSHGLGFSTSPTYNYKSLLLAIVDHPTLIGSRKSEPGEHCTSKLIFADSWWQISVASLIAVLEASIPARLVNPS